MSERIPEKMRAAVAERAAFRCEYCGIPDLNAGLAFHADHIRALKHGGKTILINLAGCCPDCNVFKGTDLGTYLGDDERFIRFFNPRHDRWADHFRNRNGFLEPLTDIGNATILLFQMNRADRVFIRQLLWEKGLWPTD